MKIVFGVLAGVMLAGTAWVSPVAAQGLPQGSYLRSCNGAAMHGDTLVATCRRADGREQRSSLAEVRRCVGDIGNNNGNLQCNYGGGHAGPPPGYGERRYGEPGYGAEMRERCIGLRREAENLRIRLDREWNPIERARTEGHLRGIQEQEARAGCRR